MKTQPNKLSLACKSAVLAMVLALTACGGNNEHAAAVDKVDEAAAAAREAAPAEVLDEPATVTAQPADTTATTDTATATTDTAVATDTTVSEPAAATTEPAPADAGGDVKAVAAGAGKELYDTKCSVCHNAGVAGAPKLDDAAAWQPRLAQGQEVLYQSVINGKGAMPPRATANDATDEELKAAVDYMTSKVIQ